MIKAIDDKYRVSVEGQLDIPFDTLQEAVDFAKEMQNEGFDAMAYYFKGEQA